jgi:hypothetical protein
MQQPTSCLAILPSILLLVLRVMVLSQLSITMQYCYAVLILQTVDWSSLLMSLTLRNAPVSGSVKVDCSMAPLQ